MQSKSKEKCKLRRWAIACSHGHFIQILCMKCVCQRVSDRSRNEGMQQRQFSTHLYPHGTMDKGCSCSPGMVVGGSGSGCTFRVQYTNVPMYQYINISRHRCTNVPIHQTSMLHYVIVSIYQSANISINTYVKKNIYICQLKIHRYTSISIY